jgi:hypothetical protein
MNSSLFTIGSGLILVKANRYWTILEEVTRPILIDTLILKREKIMERSCRFCMRRIATQSLRIRI